MKQLSAADASFLYMETDTTFGHTNGLYLYRMPFVGFDPLSAVRAKYGSLVGQLEPLRRRLVEVPFGLDHPFWVADPAFDLHYHVRALNLAPPGGMQQLNEQVARIVGRAMDRTRPFWEVYVIQGLASGDWALLTKMHHSAVDGAAGQLILTALHDIDPEAPPPGPSPTWEPEAIPTDAELVRLVTQNLWLNPYKAAEASAAGSRDGRTSRRSPVRFRPVRCRPSHPDRAR